MVKKMKIVSWNCCMKFREDIKAITDNSSKIYGDADIYVIAECENPREPNPNYIEYKETVEKLFKDNYHWIGDYHPKGLGIFAREGVELEEIETYGDFKYFMAFRVDDSFNLLCVWAMPKYVQMIHDFLDANKENEELFKKDLIICGDFNSNVSQNHKHKAKDRSGNHKNHTNLDKKLRNKGLYSVYHKLSGECNGEETRFTFFQGSHLNAPFHFDYFYANEELINKLELVHYFNTDKDDELPNKFEILDSKEWIALSDHLPLVLKFE